MKSRNAYLGIAALLGLASFAVHAANGTSLRVQVVDQRGVPVRDAVVELEPAAGLLRVAGQLSHELGMPFAEAKTGDAVQGRLVRSVEMTSGRQALIERSRDFTLVPWRPVLDRHIGKSVAGIMRDGGVSWTLGRQRSGPSIS